MNNWCLLLLAVVAVIHPIESFTELNLIDGRQECCDHHSHSVTQDYRLYGTYRKNTPEERRLSSKEDIREEQRYEARNNPITRSKERLTLERAERRFFPKSQIRFSAETQFARDPDRRHRSAVTTEFRQEPSRRIRDSFSRDSMGHHERDVLDSRRFRMTRDDTRTGHIANERMYKESLDSRDARRVRDSEDLRHISTNRETMTALKRERDVSRDAVRRDSRNNAFRSVTRLQLDNNREHRSSDQRTRDIVHERRSRSLESKVDSVNAREELRSRIESRENRRNNFRIISEGIDEHRTRGQNREASERTSAVLHDKSKRILSDSRRDTIEQVNRSKRDIKQNHNNERIDESRHQRDESRLSGERLSMLRGSRLSASVERRQALTRESRISKENANSERIMSDDSDDRTEQNERREVTRNIFQASRDSTTERRQHSRVSRMLEATVRDERLVSDERDERHQPSTRSLDRVSVRSFRVSRSIEREYNSARFPERNVRDDRAARYRKDVRSMETLDERREQRDENRMSRDRTIAMVGESRDSVERIRQETRKTGSLSRIGMNARSERESKTHGDLRDDVRFDIRRSKREEQRPSREQTIYGVARDAERRHDHKLSRTSRFTERASSGERVSRMSNPIRRERLYLHRGFPNGKVRDIPLELEQYGVRQTSPNAETNARLQKTKTQDSRNERREVREPNENKVSDDRISMNGQTLERTENQRRESRGTSDSRVDARNKVTRSREDVQIRRDGKRTNKKELGNVRNNIRDFRAMESRRENRRLTEREVEPNKPNLAMERMDRRANRANRDMRIEAKLRSSDIVFAKHMPTDTRRDAVDNRFQSFEAKINAINPDHTSDSQNVMTWQMVFYTLQGAYLFGLLMQMLTEKSNKGKPRNFAWCAASFKDLVKVD